MKKVIVVLFLFSSFILQAQVGLEGYSKTIKAGVGYTRDFPGLGGYTLFAEYSQGISPYLDVNIGFKRMNMSGYPRTNAVNEFTRASTIDMGISVLPFNNEVSIFKFGAGYSFSFYNTRRSYPLVQTQGTEKVTTWPVQDQKSRTSGLILSAEYEYVFPSSISLGMKASLCKAYDQVFYIGPFIGLRF